MATGRMEDPIVIAGGTPKEILTGLKKLTGYSLTDDQEYVCLKLLYNVSKYATLSDILKVCASHAGSGVTRKQMDSIAPFVNALKQSIRV